jgi:hypothetical protein
MPIPVGVIVVWEVVLVLEPVVTRAMVRLVVIQVLMTIAWIPTGTCSLKMLVVAFRLMALLGMVHLGTVTVLPVMVWAMVVMASTVVPVLDMVTLQLLRMRIQMLLMLVMQVVNRVLLEVHGVLKLPQDMGLWAMGMLLHGVVQVLELEVVVLVQYHLVNRPVELLLLLHMVTKVTDTVGTMEAKVLSGTQVGMVPLGDVLEVFQTATPGQESFKGLAVATLEVDIAM